MSNIQKRRRIMCAFKNANPNLYLIATDARAWMRSSDGHPAASGGSKKNMAQASKYAAKLWLLPDTNAPVGKAKSVHSSRLSCLWACVRTCFNRTWFWPVLELWQLRLTGWCACMRGILTVRDGKPCPLKMQLMPKRSVRAWLSDLALCSRITVMKWSGPLFLGPLG